MLRFVGFARGLVMDLSNPTIVAALIALCGTAFSAVVGVISAIVVAKINARAKEPPKAAETPVTRSKPQFQEHDDVQVVRRTQPTAPRTYRPSWQQSLPTDPYAQDGAIPTTRPGVLWSTNKPAQKTHEIPTEATVGSVSYGLVMTLIWMWFGRSTEGTVILAFCMVGLLGYCLVLYVILRAKYGPLE